MKWRPTRALALTAGIALAACGTENSDSSPPAPEDTAAAVAGAPSTEAAPAADETPATEAAPAATEAAPAPTDPTDSGDEAEPEPAATEATAPEPTTMMAEAPEVGGRAFATEVESDAQFDGNPFPDLVVEDVGRDGQANLANILPSDRPVLLWAWAPH